MGFNRETLQHWTDDRNSIWQFWQNFKIFLLINDQTGRIDSPLEMIVAVSLWKQIPLSLSRRFYLWPNFEAKLFQDDLDQLISIMSDAEVSALFLFQNLWINYFYSEIWQKLFWRGVIMAVFIQICDWKLQESH